MTDSASVAVVGAGPAGAAVAHALDDHADVSVFEAGDAVGGRAATATAGGCRYDYAANYVSSGDERVDALVRGLDEGDLVDVAEPVWTHDATGAISEGRPTDGHRWTFRQGVAELPRRLLDRAPAAVHTDAPVAAVERHDDAWLLADADGRDRGRHDAVVLTPPAPATADLLEAAEFGDSSADSGGSTVDSGNPTADAGDPAADPGDPIREECQRACEAVAFRPIVSAVLHYPFKVDRPYYALVDVSKEHPVGWLSREECKPGHVPPGESLLVVQLSPAVSAARFDDPDDAVADAAANLVVALLDDARFRDPDWSAVHRFRHALPDEAADTGPLRRAEAEGCFFAGDWVAGEGRVHLALRGGLDVADRVREQFE